MIEDLSVLLNFKIEVNNLILRLDNAGLRNFDNTGRSICEITLSEFSNKENLSNNFEELIGEVFEYEIYPKDNKTVLEFWGDYGRIERTIECGFVKEIFSKYTMEDLCQKGKIIADSHSSLYEKFIQNEHRNSTINNKLKVELKDEIERFRRKAQFFEDKDKGKSEAFYSQIKVLQKLSHFLEKPF